MFLKNKQRGQGMTEYIIILVLIAAAGIAAFKIFGGTMQTTLGGVAEELAGTDSNTALAQGKTQAAAVVSEGAALEGMGDYDSGNR